MIPLSVFPFPSTPCHKRVVSYPIIAFRCRSFNLSIAALPWGRFSFVQPLSLLRRQGRVAAPSVCFAVACILLAAAPTAPPCFRRWRRSSPLPQRGSHWRVGPLCADRWKLNITQKIVPCYRDSQQLDKGYCPEVAALCSRALLFLIQINFARPAWALPARQWLSLWESWRVAPERATASASPAEPAPHRRDVRGGSWAGPGQPEAQGQAQRPPGAALRPSFRPRGRRWWAEGAAPAGA